MTIVETNPIQEAMTLLETMRKAGVSIRVDGDNLKVIARRNHLADREVQALRRYKPTIIDLLNRGPSEALIAPDPEHRFEPFPLTDIQRAYWVGHQNAFELGDVAIHYYSEVQCSPLDTVAFERAVNAVIQRHDMLRAVVDEEGNQRILEQVPPYRVTVEDWRELTAADRTSRLEALRDRWSHSRRDSSRWPGLDFVIARLNDYEDRLLASIDLLHVDGGSLLILFDDLYRYYRNPDHTPAPLTLSYRDYTLAELRLQETPEYRQDLEYWREQVGHLPPAPDLPRARKVASATRFQRRVFTLNSTQSQRLYQRAAELSITPTVLVMTAFAETLRPWCGSEDFTLNVTLFNRLPVHEQVNQIIGDFTSMILVPVRHRENDTLMHRARQLQQALWRGIEHRRVSGVKVLAEYNRQSDSGSGTMPIVFTSLLDLAGQGLPCQRLAPFGEELFTLTQTPQVSLDHQVMPDGAGGLHFSWDYAEDHFAPGVIDDLFDTFQTRVAQLTESEALWQRSLIHTLPDWQERLIRESNETTLPFDESLTLRALFERSAQRWPEEVAVVAGKSRFRYRDLDQQRRIIAEELRTRGIKSGGIVALMMTKGWEQIVACLACHSAGCAYLPIDPEQPDERIRYQLENSGAAAMLTQPGLHQRAQGLIAGPCLAISNELLKGAPLDLLPDLDGSDLSHLIYTSGSTGKPKGVMIEHRQVVNRILDINTRFDIGPRDRVLALTALHHDLSVYDIFGTLAAGGTIVIPEADRRLDPEHWSTLIQQHQITLWNSVPAFLDMWLDYAEQATPAFTELALRFFILAGDWIPVNQPGRVRKLLPEARFIASGGPTETTIWDIYHPVTPLSPKTDSIPYGKPLANSQYHILDRLGRPCPVWVRGEMYISGAGVTRGYINNPKMTRERYVTLADGTRAFRSGDLGRYLPDGQIEFLGRNDFQVKIQGMRIELPEIEAVAEQLPAVSRALALVAKTPQGPSLKLWLQAALAEEDSPDQAKLEAEHRDFAESGAAVTDAAERLQAKLTYPALRAPQERQLMPLPDDWHSALKPYRSHRHFARSPIPQRQFEQWLALFRARWAEDEVKSLYGSAGGLFPVQLYLHLKRDRVEGMAPGLYRYYPLEHALEKLDDSQPAAAEHYAHNQRLADAAALSLYFVLHRPTIEPLYGNLSESMAYREVGMIEQLLRLESPKLEVGTCPIGALKQQADIRRHWDPEQTLLASDLVGLLPEKTAEEDNAPSNAEPTSESELVTSVRQRLEATLPAYMVPAEIGVLARFPLTANGKVDRRALLEQSAHTQTHQPTYRPPDNELERILAEILQTLLDVEQVSTRARFFDLGANSALLVRAYHEFKKRTGLEFKLITLFQHPTVASVVAQLQSGDTTGTENSPEAAAPNRAQAERRKRILKTARKGDPQ
ncbi:non-ribosomal peptide synthetase [Marinimicrobium locisalis]|uniref:non-ribosomal peptide synthetase n=1 Tax=Marinimicrobium locisalis TaxID=546022 RepID=UPI003221DC8C